MIEAMACSPATSGTILQNAEGNSPGDTPAKAWCTSSLLEETPRFSYSLPAMRREAITPPCHESRAATGGARSRATPRSSELGLRVLGGSREGDAGRRQPGLLVLRRRV